MGLYQIKAGAGKANIVFPDEMFPTDNLYGVHDVPHARILVLDAGVRVAIASLELVNLPDDLIDFSRTCIEELTGTPYENVWVHVTHAITTPHQPGGPGPGGPSKDPETLKKKEMFSEAIKKAVAEAAAAAAADFGDASIGVGTGECDVNVNRDVETPFGWWVQQNPEEISNKTMTILRVNGANGKPKALLISYGLKPCAIDQSERKSPERKVCTDVPGYACSLLEEKMNAPCLFCMSAAGDQVTREQAWYETVLEDGTVGEIDLGVQKGYEIVERLGTEMAQDAQRIAETIVCDERESLISTASGCICCDVKGRTPPSGAPGPKKTLEFKAEGTEKLGAEVIVMGDIAFVANKPETNTRTEKELWEASPYKHTLLMVMVNGGMKYMPDRLAYERVTWEAQRAMLAPGTAEKWVQRAAALLHSLKEGKPEPVVTAVTEQSGEGQFITKAVIEFDGELPDVSAITVKDRTITGISADGN